MNKLKYTSAVIIFASLLALSSCTSPEGNDIEDKTDQFPVSVSETSFPETETVSQMVSVTSVSVSSVTEIISIPVETSVSVSVSTVSAGSTSEVSGQHAVSDTEIQSGDTSVSVKDQVQTEADGISEKHEDVTSEAVTTEAAHDIEINENGELVLPEIFF